MLDAERAIAGTMSSGIEIAVRIAKLLKDRHTGDEEADYLKFEAKQYLKLGQDENSVRIAFGMIKSDLSICPKRIREAPHAYLRWLLKKAPTEITKKCKEIEHQINAFANFMQGYEPSHRLYSAFYGNEDSDNPELEPVQGPGWRRRGANPVRVTGGLLSNLGGFVIRIRILCILHVSCMYFACILM